MTICKLTLSVLVCLCIFLNAPVVYSYSFNNGELSCYVNVEDGGNKTMNSMLFHGLYSKDMEMIKTAISRGANLNARDSCIQPVYFTPLLFSIFQSDMTLFQYLISQGADVNHMRSGVEHPLAVMLMQESRKFDFIKALVEAGARINNIRWTGESAIELVAKWGEDSNSEKQYKRQVLQYLISKGADANSGRFCLPIISATDRGLRNSADFTTIKMLMAAGADPARKHIPKPDDAPYGCDNISAVDVAIRSGNKDWIKFMLPYSSGMPMKKENTDLNPRNGLGTASPVQAASWVKVADSATTSHFVDKDSITRNADGSIDAWVKITNDRPDCTSDYAVIKQKCIIYSVGLERYFGNRTNCFIEDRTYFSDGSNENVVNECGEIYRLVPGSVGELVWKYLYR